MILAPVLRLIYIAFFAETGLLAKPIVSSTTLTFWSKSLKKVKILIFLEFSFFHREMYNKGMFDNAFNIYKKLRVLWHWEKVL